MKRQTQNLLLSWKAWMIGISIFGTGFANGETKIVEVVGKLDPKFSVEISQEDMKRIADEFSTLRRLDPIRIDINELANPKDADAIALTKVALAETMLSTVVDIVDLKAMVYKYAALIQVPQMQASLTELNKTYQGRIQKVYSKMIERLYARPDKIHEAIKLCGSELCAGTIQQAYLELPKLGAALNTGLTFGKKWKSKNPLQFQSKVFEESVEQLYDSLQRSSQNHAVYAGLIHMALVPFVTASRGAVDLGQALSQIFSGPQYSKIGLTASKFVGGPTISQADVSREVEGRIYSIVNGEAKLDFMQDLCLQELDGITLRWYDGSHFLRFKRDKTKGLVVIPSWGADAKSEVPIHYGKDRIFFRWTEQNPAYFIMLVRKAKDSWEGYYPVTLNLETMNENSSRADRTTVEILN